MTSFDSSRRRLLASLLSIGTVGFIAGCSSSDSPDGETSENESGDDGSPSTDADSLDLREANVVDVGFEPERDSFDVTLHHDDDGEDGYANWW